MLASTGIGYLAQLHELGHLIDGVGPTSIDGSAYWKSPSVKTKPMPYWLRLKAQLDKLPRIEPNPWGIHVHGGWVCEGEQRTNID